jgi:hypothetical protein
MFLIAVQKCFCFRDSITQREPALEADRSARRQSRCDICAWQNGRRFTLGGGLHETGIGVRAKARREGMI